MSINEERGDMKDEFDEKAIAARLRAMADELDAGEAFVFACNTNFGMPRYLSKSVDVRSTKNGFVSLKLAWTDRV